METRSLDVVLSRPGIYVVMSPRIVVFCEVDADGKCHQLRPRDFARDGELRPGLWRLDSNHTFYGPLVRPEVRT
jgi:hypothetical protein